MAAAPRGVWEQRRLGCRLGPLAPLLMLAQALLLLPAAGAGLCPAPCSCRLPLLDCSRRKLPALSWRALSGPLSPDISSLDLSHNRLSNWNISLESETLQEVKMNYNELTEIPYFGEPTPNITQLSLVHNLIPEINAEAFQLYSALESLDLSSNIISEIKTSSFPRMSLKYLNLSNNRITTLEAGCFDNLSGSLLVVKLNRNRISMIPPKVFKLPHLQFLELKRNRIKIVEGLTFQGLDSLRSLKMQRNGISKLKDGAFFGLNNMEELELEHNNLTGVHKGWLYGLRMLQQLYVSQNAIEKISPDAWEFCQRLSALDLRNNEISWAIEDASEVFSGLKSLTKLILQGNRIKSVTQKAFVGLESLEYLDLNNNAIMSIQENAFSQTHLKELVLNTSSLLCDCHLKWLLQWLVDNNFHHSVNVSCAHPEWLAGQSILNVDLKDFVCDDFLKPQIRTHPENTVALRGVNVTLMCTAVSSSDSPMSTLWRKDSEILYDVDIENFVRYRQQDGEALEYTSVLRLFSVNFTDEGKYQCIVTNHFGSNYSQKAKLTVNEMPSFLKTPMDLTIRTGAMARLECAAEGHPTPQISWQKDGGTDFPAARERRMHVMPEDDVFFIANVKIEDMGIYSCMAQNIAGGLSANASLTVLETPSFIRPLEDKTVTRGETAVLQCIAGGSPAPRLNWTKDDGPLLVTERHFFAAANQLLIIVDAGLEDAGKYTCLMSNTLGTERGHIYLNVISSPNCDSSQNSIGHEDDGWTTVGIVIIVVVCCVVGTSLIWVIVIYHMRRKDEDYSITNTEELNLPADIPSYLSSQGTLSEPQEGYSNSEAGSHQQLMPPASGYTHKGTDGGTGTRVICSDCYDNANIYSRTREYCPYTYIAEEDALDQALSSLMVQMPKETFLSHPPQDAANLESLMPPTERELSAFPTNHERTSENLPFSQRSSEIFQRPLWNMNRDLGLLPFPQQPVLESPQLAERDPNCSSPVSCHRLHDHAFDFSRTRNIQDGTEGT
ncbi:leucine-rich repeats and immunoglobulin-like domains protein 2 isoform X2 [Rattus norvegicus]|uniref:Leucine-rich repeats and immunoglobulin-like domains 2 n=1 Tax=Rattus norvegicus TaxID=10116 RepID=A0ABK0LJW3_RAT|nr:leucine-rich repeats and immunoglobulin-like domains protein 2 isoform X3 [Rattus norvegicus]|eukprot:XP_017446405.1 PREDICTED: leucine-rich repeats and immunoglobulin-like domains protein 2 isoform X2 [Rattus norvegicus]